MKGKGVKKWAIVAPNYEYGQSAANNFKKLIKAATPDAEHAKQLTRDEITASVHYVGFDLTAQQVADFADRPVRVRLSHPAYSHGTLLTAETRAE